MAAGFNEEEKRTASVLSSLRLSWFSVIHVFTSSVHALSSFLRLLFHWEGWISGALCHKPAKSWQFTEQQWWQRQMWCTGWKEPSQHWALRHVIRELWWWQGRVTDSDRGLISVCEIIMTQIIGVQKTEYQKERAEMGEENMLQKDQTAEEQKRCRHHPEWSECRLKHLTTTSLNSPQCRPIYYRTCARMIGPFNAQVHNSM